MYCHDEFWEIKEESKEEVIYGWAKSIWCLHFMIHKTINFFSRKTVKNFFQELLTVLIIGG